MRAGTASPHPDRRGRSRVAVRHAWAQPHEAGACGHERQIPELLPHSESAVFLIIVGLGVFVPENIEGVKQRLCTAEQKIFEIRFPVTVEAHDFTVENTAAAAQVASQTFAQFGKTLKRVSVARAEPHAFGVGMEQCPESVPLNLKQPVWMREWRMGAA